MWNKNTDYYFEKLAGLLNKEDVDLLSKLIESVREDYLPETHVYSGIDLLEAIRDNIIRDRLVKVIIPDREFFIYVTNSGSIKWNAGEFDTKFLISKEIYFIPVDLTIMSSVDGISDSEVYKQFARSVIKCLE